MSSQWRRKMMFKRSKLNEKKKIQLTEDYKQDICQHAYLGKKGYTIPKSILREDDLYNLYEELKVKPNKRTQTVLQSHINILLLLLQFRCFKMLAFLNIFRFRCLQFKHADL